MAASQVHGRVSQWYLQEVQRGPVDTKSSALTNKSLQLPKVLQNSP